MNSFWKFQPVAAVAMAALLVGCGGQPARESAVVTGTVIYQGKPLPDAEVHLFPKTDINLAAHNATTDENGKFVIRTDGRGGRPVEPGTYVAVITKYVSKASDPMSGTNIVPQQYTDRTKSPLVVEIKTGTNEIPPFTLGS